MDGDAVTVAGAVVVVVIVVVGERDRTGRCFTATFFGVCFDSVVRDSNLL